MNTLRCGCPNCEREVDPDRIFNHDGELYCSEACALQHVNGEACPLPTCHCGCIGKIGDRSINDAQLDEALEETFPASDPISP
jgi:hypothetical protein